MSQIRQGAVAINVNPLWRIPIKYAEISEGLKRPFAETSTIWRSIMGLSSARLGSMAKNGHLTTWPENIKDKISSEAKRLNGKRVRLFKWRARSKPEINNNIREIYSNQGAKAGESSLGGRSVAEIGPAANSGQEPGNSRQGMRFDKSLVAAAPAGAPDPTWRFGMRVDQPVVAAALAGAPDSNWGRQAIRADRSKVFENSGATPTGDQGVGTVSDADKQAFKIAAEETRDRSGAFDSFASLVRRVTGPFRDLGAAFGKLVSRMADKLLTVLGRQTAEAKAAADDKAAAVAEAAEAKAAKKAENVRKITELIKADPSVLSTPDFLRATASDEARKKRLNAPDEYYADVEAALTSSEGKKLEDKFWANLSANLKVEVADAFTIEDHSQYNHLAFEYDKRKKLLGRYAKVPSIEELPTPLKNLFNLGLEMLKVNNSEEHKERRDIIQDQVSLCNVIFNTPQGDSGLDFDRLMNNHRVKRQLILDMIKLHAPFAPEKAPEN